MKSWDNRSISAGKLKRKLHERTSPPCDTREERPYVEQWDSDLKYLNSRVILLISDPGWANSFNY